ncbi:MAG: peroxiredoxin [Alphaproteobacteria bacterium]|nr:peroxiredoxin [Alphaproteobacteria bacterium]
MSAALEYIRLGAGDPAPWFTARGCSNPEYRFDTAAGRYIVLGFFASANSAGGQEALAIVRENRQLFDDNHLTFFGVSVDPGDEKRGVLKTELPGIRWFWDTDLAVSRLYGSVARNFTPGADGRISARRVWYVLDPTMRIMKTINMDGNPNHGAEEAQGGQESGFMRDVGGKTVGIVDYGLKRRSDVVLTDETLLGELRARMKKRLVPEIEKVHFFHATRIERFIVACYDGANGGFFRPHRDHTTKGTAHRRFAVTINLNNDFEGGELNFPEYGPRTFKPPPGGAVVFSCALLHAVTPVTKGKRYAFLPFLYDEAAAKIRAENQQFLEDKSLSVNISTG